MIGKCVEFPLEFDFIIQPLHLLIGLNLTITNEHTEELGTQEDTLIFIPSQIVDDITDRTAVKMSFAVFTETALFPVRGSDGTSETTSSVVGSQVVSASVAGVADGTTLSAPVTISLRLTNAPSLRGNETITDRKCVYWDYTAAGEMMRYISCVRQLYYV